jgi:hypothetical protein
MDSFVYSISINTRLTPVWPSPWSCALSGSSLLSICYRIKFGHMRNWDLMKISSSSQSRCLCSLQWLYLLLFHFHHTLSTVRRLMLEDVFSRPHNERGSKRPRKAIRRDRRIADLPQGKTPRSKPLDPSSLHRSDLVYQVDGPCCHVQASKRLSNSRVVHVANERSDRRVAFRLCGHWAAFAAKDVF